MNASRVPQVAVLEEGFKYVLSESMPFVEERVEGTMRTNYIGHAQLTAVVTGNRAVEEIQRVDVNNVEIRYPTGQGFSEPNRYRPSAPQCRRKIVNLHATSMYRLVSRDLKATSPILVGGENVDLMTSSRNRNCHVHAGFGGTSIAWRQIRNHVKNLHSELPSDIRGVQYWRPVRQQMAW
jgi:hypothetical protein